MSLKNPNDTIGMFPLIRFKFQNIVTCSVSATTKKHDTVRQEIESMQSYIGLIKMHQNYRLLGKKMQLNLK
jgi:hypothetical protein